MVTTQDKPHNYPLYSVHLDIGSFIFYNDGNIQEQIPNKNTKSCQTEEFQANIKEHDEPDEPLWNLSFDRVISK